MPAVAKQGGIEAIPEAQGAIPPTSEADLDRAIEALQAGKQAWVRVGIPERIQILRGLVEHTLDVAADWVREAVAAKSIDPCSGAVAEEWLGGPFSVIRNLRLLIASLEDVLAHGKPRIAGGVRTLPSGQVAARIFPVDTFDKIFYAGFVADLYMRPGVDEGNLPDTMATLYARPEVERSGKVALVLGAGNVSSIGPLDALYKLFVEDQVAILKMNPVNAYVGPFVERAFAPLVDAGYLRVVYGGVKVGIYLCEHPGVEEIHITGSDKTHDAIVYGVGPEGARRKAERSPKNPRRITSELGNVSPVIVVPGPWKDGDLSFQGENIASMLTNNAGFNCNAVRVVIQHAGWSQREALLAAIRRVLASVPPRVAYYPGAAQRYEAFLSAHPDAETFGPRSEHALPWTLVSGVDPGEAADICFTTEAFCSVFSETALEAESVPDYIDRAVEMCNERIWGSLNAAIIVHPESMKQPAVAEAVERGIANLRYGTVALNHWPAVGYALGVTSWGAYPGHEAHDIQSGSGVVHNTLMFEKIEKSVIRGPFRMKPKPPWFVTHRTGHEMGPKLTRFEARPSVWKVPSIIWSALRG